MGLLDGMQQQQQPAGGLLGAMQQMPQMPQGQPAAQEGGIPPMPPELAQAIEQMKGAPPEQQQQFVQQVVEKIKSMPKPPEQVQQVLQQFMQAMGQG